ncbi:MAG: hypothetical protein BWY96_01902 [Spirochaetes bacterium ADurb.BinA120]|nr:MAG: hypothetical protein BWY96_01902 [Spirochaetes bacterium ADurb.BinA120]
MVQPGGPFYKPGDRENAFPLRRNRPFFTNLKERFKEPRQIVRLLNDQASKHAPPIGAIFRRYIPVHVYDSRLGVASVHNPLFIYGLHGYRRFPVLAGRVYHVVSVAFELPRAFLKLHKGGRKRFGPFSVRCRAAGGLVGLLESPGKPAYRLVGHAAQKRQVRLYRPLQSVNALRKTRAQHRKVAGWNGRVKISPESSAGLLGKGRHIRFRLLAIPGVYPAYALYIRREHPANRFIEAQRTVSRPYV